MDPAQGALLDYVLSGKPIGLGVLILIVIVVARLGTKLEVHARSLVEAVGKLGSDLTSSHDADTKDHAATRESVTKLERRVDVVEANLTKAISTDGELTRRDLADKRLSEIRSSIEEIVEPEPLPRRTKTSPGLR